VGMLQLSNELVKNPVFIADIGDILDGDVIKEQ